MRFRFVGRGVCLAAVALAMGCGDDTSTGPDGLDFPTLSSTVRSLFCVRGNTTVGRTETGTIATSDCEEDGSYYETYLVKVASSGETRFTLSTPFDGLLVLVEITNIDDDNVDFEEVEYVDEELEGEDEDLYATLQSGKTYAIIVSGWASSDTGPYTLRIR